MKIWIALFRAVNVGGKNKVTMVQLKSVFESVGCENVRTYIQSGNVVFSSNIRSKPKLQNVIADATESQFGFRPHVMLLSDTELQSAITSNPFPKATDDPKKLHFYFLQGQPNPADVSSLDQLASNSEQYQIHGNVFYLHAPDGVGTSKLASSVERRLKVPATARNFSTVHKLAAMIADSDRNV